MRHKKSKVWKNFPSQVVKTLVTFIVGIFVSIGSNGQTSIPSQLTFDLNAPDYRSWNVSVKTGEGTSLTGHLDVPSSYTGKDYNNILRTLPVTVIWDLSSNISSVHIPNSITRIEDNGFATSTKLKSIVIPNSVNYVGVYAFKGCTALKSVVISPNNKCSSSFSGCDIKKGAYPAGNRAFVADIEVAYPAYCIPDSAGLVFDSTMSEFYFAPWDVQYLEIPETVSYIGPKALAGCTKIKKLSVGATTPPSVESDTFDGAVISVLEVPYGCKEAYINAPGWSAFASKIVESEPTITINPENISLKQGETAQLSVYLGNSLSNDGSIEWSSSDNSIAEVDGNGKVTAISVGTAIISALYDNLIATAMVTVVPSQVGESRIQVNGLYFSLHDTPTYEAHLERPLSGVYEETSYYVPEKITFAGVEYVVTKIEERAFFKDFAHIIPLQKIYLPSSIVEIGESAFEGCYDLQTVVIPSESVLSIINKKAFKSCKSLKNLRLPDTVKYIGGEGFSGCESLEEIYLGKSLREIGYSCFYGCVKLKKIQLLDNVEHIQGNAFQECTSLYEVVMKNSVTSISMCAFKGCSALQKVTLSNALESINEELFSGCTALKEIKIPDNIRQISMRAFSGCVNLENVIMPFSGDVKSLGYLAFENCSKLQSFIIPPSCIVSKGGSMDTFSGCSGLIKAAYPSKLGGNPFPSGVAIGYGSDSAVLEDGIIWSKDKSTIYYASIEFTGEIPYPETLTKINDYAFYKCSLSDCDTLVIGKNVSYLGNRAFADCGTIGHLMIKEGEVSVNIGEYAFSGVPIQDIYLGRNFINNSYSYDAKPFSSNGCLERLVIGPKVTLIGSRSFAKCQNLKEVIIEDSSETLEFRYGDCVFGESPFETLYLGRNIYFDEIYYQSDHPFKNNDQLKTLYIGSSVSSLGTKNFGNCVSLQNILILDGNSQLTIEDDILKKLPLRNLQVGRELTYAGSTTLLENHNSLENVWITDRVKNINSFSNCLSLKTVYLGDAISTIKNNVFLNCANLNLIDIGIGVKEIQATAFSGCSNLKSIYMHAETPPVLNYEAFDKNIFNQSELHYPSTSSYLSAENWSKFKNTSNNFEIVMGYENVSASSGDIITLVINAEEDIDMESVLLLSSNPAIAQILDDMKSPTSLYIKNGVRMQSRSVKVKINRAEEVTIAAFTQRGQMAKCVINRGLGVPVEDIPAETIILNMTEVILKESESVELVATVMPETTTDKTVTWMSSDESVAVVDENGLVTAISMGKAVISAICGDISKTCAVTVTKSSGVDGVVAEMEYPIEVYNLQGIGIRISNAEDLKKLSQGLYIINGKKYIVK